jgi:hypothetical protein
MTTTDKQEPVYVTIFGERIGRNGGAATAEVLAAEKGCLRVFLRDGSVFEGPAKNCTSSVLDWRQWRAFLREFDIDIIAYQIGHKVDVTALMAQLDAALAENARLREALKPFGEYLDKAAFDLNHKGEPLPDGDCVGWVYLTNGDFRRAREAYRSKPNA